MAIYTDLKTGLPLNEYEESFDSAVRAGILALTYGNYTTTIDTSKYEALPNSPGWLRRYPYDDGTSSNNEWNFTRDQLIPLVTGLSSQGHHKVVRRVLIAHLKRFLLLCQSFQHDVPGSWKYPWPHKTLERSKKGKWVLCDFPDILLPHQLFVLIKGAKLSKVLTFFCLLASLPFFLLDLFFHAKVFKHYEENQMFCVCAAYGKWALRLYKKLKPNWIDINREYWYTRNEKEYADLMERWLESETK